MTTIHIQAQTVNDWHDRRTSSTRPPHVRIYSSADFFTSDMVFVSHGGPNEGNIYKDVTCTQVGTVVTIPAFDIDSTENASSLTQNAKYSLYFYTASGAQISRTPFLSNIAVPETIASLSGCTPSGTCCTLDDLAAYNNSSPPLAADTYYTARRVDQLILANVGAGTVSVLTTSPLAGGGALSDDLTLSMPAASGSQNGYLASADWTTFNGKQAALGFTAVPNTRTVNGHALSANVTVTPTDLGLVIGTNVQAWDADLDTVAARGTSLQQIRVNVEATGLEYFTPSGSAVWGAITGTLGDQTDLNTALGLKAPLASPTFTDNGVAINPTADSLMRGFEIAQTASGAPATDYSLNRIIISSDNMDAGSGFGSALGVVLTFGGSAAKGGRVAFDAELHMTSATNAANANRNYVGFVGLATANASDGGTLGAEQGAMFGANRVGFLASGATNFLQVTAGEDNFGIATGASAQMLQGVSIVTRSDHAVAARLINTSLGISAQGGALGLSHAILIGSQNGAHPLLSTGTILGTTGAGGTVANGIDLSGYTITGTAFKSPNFQITGAGKIGFGVVPTYPLDILVTDDFYPARFSGSGAFNQNILFNSAATFNNSFVHQVANASYWYVGMNGTTFDYRILNSDANGNDELLRLTQAGDLIIAGTAWTSYNPTVTSSANTITTLGTVTGRYKQLGKTVWFQVSIGITTNGTGSGYVKATLPFTAAAFSFGAVGRENVITGKGLIGEIVVSGTTLDIRNIADNTYPGSDGVRMELWGEYEVP